MTISKDELKRLLGPVVAAVALIACGAALIGWSESSMQAARRALATAQQELKRDTERLSRIAEEEREVKANLAIYQQLQQLKVLGPERRLEWADAIARIREERELLDLRYRVERQKLISALPGKPANVEFYASTMSVHIALLHEEDLLRFLADLRASGNAYYSVKQCALQRNAPAAAGLSTAPRLRADCVIDLITVVDGAAKQ